MISLSVLCDEFDFLSFEARKSSLKTVASPGHVDVTRSRFSSVETSGHSFSFLIGAAVVTVFTHKYKCRGTTCHKVVGSRKNLRTKPKRNVSYWTYTFARHNSCKTCLETNRRASCLYGKSYPSHGRGPQLDSPRCLVLRVEGVSYDLNRAS